MKCPEECEEIKVGDKSFESMIEGVKLRTESMIDELLLSNSIINNPLILLRESE